MRPREGRQWCAQTTSKHGLTCPVKNVICCRCVSDTVPLVAESQPDIAAVAARDERLAQLHLWLPQSLIDWIDGEARRRGLRKSTYVRTHFTAMRERAEAQKP